MVIVVFGTVIGYSPAAARCKVIPPLKVISFMLPHSLKLPVLPAQQLCVIAADSSLAGVAIYSCRHSGRYYLWLPHCVIQTWRERPMSHEVLLFVTGWRGELIASVTPAVGNAQPNVAR